ncbi:hypothetical protein LJC69_00535 [Bacteroidales bacterium OttesenSCG-928-K22]|nr:hypothetical protein [Bacteroidales bacterium OttesenSCG-928-K22]
MTMNKDNLSELFRYIDLDEPRIDFAERTMCKIENVAQPNRISLKTFMILIIGASAILFSSLLIVFKDNIVFFIQRTLAPFIFDAMDFIKNFSWADLNNFSLIMTIVSCLALIFAVIQLFANRSREASKHGNYINN